ncbi:hypothetical protein P7C70_g4488, partial [Phenoliferia sp. Uapishka_3]
MASGTRRLPPSTAYMALISKEQRQEDGTFETKYLGTDADSLAALRPTPAPLKVAKAKAQNLVDGKKTKAKANRVKAAGKETPVAKAKKKSGLASPKRPDNGPLSNTKKRVSLSPKSRTLFTLLLSPRLDRKSRTVESSGSDESGHESNGDPLEESASESEDEDPSMTLFVPVPPKKAPRPAEDSGSSSDEEDEEPEAPDSDFEDPDPVDSEADDEEEVVEEEDDVEPVVVAAPTPRRPKHKIREPKPLASDDEDEAEPVAVRQSPRSAAKKRKQAEAEADDEDLELASKTAGKKAKTGTPKEKVVKAKPKVSIHHFSRIPSLTLTSSSALFIVLQKTAAKGKKRGQSKAVRRRPSPLFPYPFFFSRSLVLSFSRSLARLSCALNDLTRSLPHVRFFALGSSLLFLEPIPRPPPLSFLSPLDFGLLLQARGEDEETDDEEEEPQLPKNIPFINTFEGDLPRQGPSTKITPPPYIKPEGGVGSGSSGQFVGMDMSLGEKAAYKMMVRICRVQLLRVGKPWAAAPDLLAIVGEVLDNARRNGKPIEWHSGFQQSCYQNAKSFVSRCGVQVKERVYKHYRFEGEYVKGRIEWDLKERAAAQQALDSCENLRADGRADSTEDEHLFLGSLLHSSAVCLLSHSPNGSLRIPPLDLEGEGRTACVQFGFGLLGMAYAGIIHALDVVKKGKGSLEFSEEYQKDCLLVVQMGATLSWSVQEVIMRKLWQCASSHTAGASSVDVVVGDKEAILKALCRKRG